MFLSFSNSIEANPQELTSYLADVIKDENLVETYNHQLQKDEFAFEIVTSLKKSEFDYKTAFKSELLGRIKEFIMSPSFLSSYLNCPRSFLYSEILKLYVYEEDNSNAIYGSSIHKSLEKTLNYAKETGMYPDFQYMLTEFKKELSTKELVSQEKRAELENRGEKYLKNLYPHFIQIPADRIFATEFYLNHIPFGKYFIKGL